MTRTEPDPPCPQAWLHTPAPRAYVAWHVWAEQMGRTHTQHRCTGCGLYRIWTPRTDAPDLPPIDYRLLHKECQCCDGEALGCDCRWCRHNLRIIDQMGPVATKDRQASTRPATPCPACSRADQAGLAPGELHAECKEQT